MMRSLWSGVSGLNTHLTEMDVIGNNISNVNTTSYKSQSTGFQDVLYQTLKSGMAAGTNTATTNTDQVGLGAKIGSISTNITLQGSAVITDNAMDLMITGDSFFCIAKDTSSESINFTRDGSFTIDAEGNLVTQNNGYYVMGVMGDAQIGDTIEAPLSLINEQTKKIAGTATSEAYFSGNIDSYDDQLEDGKTLGIEVFGSDGNTYTIKFNLTDDEDDADNTFRLALTSVQDSKGKVIAGEDDLATHVHLVYDKHSGVLTSANGDTKGNVKVSFTGDAAVLGQLNIDFTRTTNYASAIAGHDSTIYGYKGNVDGLNKGYANGEMTGLSFTDNGSIYAKYSNGQTVRIAHIAVAEFNNASGLEKVGDNLFAASLNSGEPMLMDVTENGGYISSGVLEGSNVNLAKEFTDMITTQRGFQANSKVITTSDELLQLLHGLKR